jgi:hypothetical protein
MGRKKGKIYKGKNRSQNDDDDEDSIEEVQTSGKYSSVKSRSSVKNSGKYITESEKEDRNEEEENQEESNNNREEEEEEDDEDDDDEEDRKYNDRPEEKV